MLINIEQAKSNCSFFFYLPTFSTIFIYQHPVSNVRLDVRHVQSRSLLLEGWKTMTMDWKWNGMGSPKTTNKKIESVFQLKVATKNAGQHFIEKKSFVFFFFRSTVDIVKGEDHSLGIRGRTISLSLSLSLLHILHIRLERERERERERGCVWVCVAT